MSDVTDELLVEFIEQHVDAQERLGLEPTPVGAMAAELRRRRDEAMLLEDRLDCGWRGEDGCGECLVCVRTMLIRVMPGSVDLTVLEFGAGALRAMLPKLLSNELAANVIDFVVTGARQNLKEIPDE